jgi:hypothetical protein
METLVVLDQQLVVEALALVAVVEVEVLVALDQMELQP